MNWRSKLFLTSLILALPAQAMADPTLLGRYGDWSVYSRFDGAQKICYTMSDAKKKSPSSVRHGDIRFLVASWKQGQPVEQPSFHAELRQTGGLVQEIHPMRTLVSA